MAWKRYVELVVRKKSDPSKAIVFSEHRIDFEVRSSVGWADSTATIEIRNLSVAEMKLLQPREFGEISVELHVGYDKNTRGLAVIPAGDGKVKAFTTSGTSYGIPGMTSTGGNMQSTHDQLFSGIVVNAVGYKQAPDHILTLFCSSHVLLGATSYFDLRPVKKDMRLRDAISQMCGDAGFSSIFYYGVNPSDLDKPLVSSYSFHDTFLAELGSFLKQFNLNYYMASNEVQIFPDTYGNASAMGMMAKDRAPVRLNMNSVIGTPIAGIGTFDVTTFITADIQPGMVLDVTRLLGEELLITGVVNVVGPPFTLNTQDKILEYAMTDKYQIYNILHKGSNFTEQFHTQIHAILGGTEMGAMEDSWKSLYIDSGRPTY